MNRKTLCGLLLLAGTLLSAGNVKPDPDSSPYGVCAHLNRMPAKERIAELQRMKQTGIRFFRTDLDWAQVEPTPGKWNFAEWDSVVSEARKLGLRPVAILGGNLPAHGKPPFEKMDAWKRYVETVVRRYRNDIHYYEVINEADCDRPWGTRPNPEHYTALLKETAQIIRSIQPDATILFTGVSDFQNPLPFVERALRAGAGSSFDVMNFHPYQWKNLPESQLRRRIQDLRDLMERYHCRKPIWITEIGNSTAPFPSDFVRAVVPAALKELGIDPARTTFGILADPVYFYCTDGYHMSSSDYLPAGSRKQVLTFRDLEKADVRQIPVLLLPGTEAFPMEVFPAVLNYVKRGGTVVVPGGLPFYFNLERLPDGSFRKGQINKDALPRLHLAWETFWTNPSVPSSTDSFEPGEKFPNLKIRKREALRFLTGDNLKPGDTLIPIVYGVKGSYKAPVAAIYRLNSDLKGNLILITNTEGFESTTEADQATLLVRQYLLAESAGVQKIFWYRLRAGEWNSGREAHFGIFHRDFSEKPAAKACRTLVGLRPVGSSPVVLETRNGVWHASWNTPDRKRVHALWLPFGKKNVPLSIRGTLREVRNLSGEKQNLSGKEFPLTDRVLYLIGGPDLQIGLP